MKTKIVVNIQGILKNVEYAVKMVMTFEYMCTSELNLIINLNVSGGFCNILLENMPFYNAKKPYSQSYVLFASQLATSLMRISRH